MVRIAESATGSRAKIAMADSDLPSLVVMGRPKNGIAPEASGGVCAMGVAGRSDGHGIRSGQQRRSEEHTSELQSLMRISYAVFCLKKKIILINTKLILIRPTLLYIAYNLTRTDLQVDYENLRTHYTQ